MPDDCIFCKIARGQIPSHKVYEDADTLAFLDVHPLTRGHTLVIPKAHAVRFEDLRAPQAERLFGVVHRILPTVVKAAGAPASQVAINNGREGGQEVPHVHVHVIPRTATDGGGPVHALFNRRPNFTMDEIAKLAESMRAQLGPAARA